MKSIIKELCFCILITAILPLLLFNSCNIIKKWKSSDLEKPNIRPNTNETEPENTDPEQIRVLLDDGTVTAMDLETYLIGVVMGEMPADFEIEALKAQAVVARTYALRNREYGSKHPEADVCVDSACCQNYVEFHEGESYDKIYQAVTVTAGQVLTYQNRLIEATYFASSGGRTEDAVAVWGNDVPYLQSTESPEDPYAQQQIETATLTVNEFMACLSLPGTYPEIQNTTYTAGGGVDTLTVCNTEFRGTELRKLLNLPSTLFQITVIGDHVVITSRGYGHRVGMSQYGAEVMAVDGATYEEILLHYYQGTTLEEFVDKDSPIG